MATPTRSAALRTLLVAWRSIARTASSRPMPVPSSLTCDQRLAAVLELDPHVARAGVERVLDQLLDRRGRALHHLARGDLVGDGVGQDRDAARHRENLAPHRRDRLVGKPALRGRRRARTSTHPALRRTTRTMLPPSSGRQRRREPVRADSGA